MKVYLTSTGSYSDYNVDGVFSTKELAEEYCFINRAYDRNEIEEKEMDDPSNLIKDSSFELGKLFTVGINIKTGCIYHPFGDSYHEKTYRHPSKCEVRINKPYKYSIGYTWYEGSIIVGSPISEDHATKVVVEKRQEYLRENIDWLWK